MKNVKLLVRALALPMATIGLAGSAGSASVGEADKPEKLLEVFQDGTQGRKPERFNNYDSWNVFFRPIV